MRKINIEVAAEQDMAISITFDDIINHRKLHNKFIKTGITMFKYGECRSGSKPAFWMATNA